MSYPRLNDSFNMHHSTGDDFDGMENELSSDLVHSIESLATVKQQHYNPYFVSDTMDLSVASSVALDSVPSSSQPSNTYGTMTMTSDTSFGKGDQEFVASPNVPTISTGRPEDFLSHLGDWHWTEGPPSTALEPTNDILSETFNETSTVQPSTETSHSKRKGFVGLMSSNTHRRDSGPQGLLQAKGNFDNVVDLLISEQELSPQQVIQARQAMCLVDERLNRFSTQQPESSANPGGCLICGASFRIRGVFTRHIKDQHYPRVVFYCPEPGCPVKQHRKDRIRDHMRIHGNEGPPIEKKVACPAACPICHLMTNGWDKFYACVFSHHQSGGSRSGNTPSRRRSSDYSQGSQGSQTRPAGIAQPDQSQWLTVPGTIPGGDSSFPTGNTNQSHQPPVRERSSSESRIASQPRLNSNSSSRPASSTYSRSSRAARRGVQRPGQSPRDRRSRPRGPSIRNNRELRCTNCEHIFHECNRSACLSMTESRFGCHNCPNRESGRSSAMPLVTQDYQQPESYLEMNPLWHEMLNSQYLETPRTIPAAQNVQTYLPGQFLPGQYDIGSFNQNPDTRTFHGNLNQRDDVNDADVFMMRDIHSPRLSEEELLSPTSLGFKSPSTDLFTSTFPWELLSKRPKDMIPTIPSLWLYDLEPSARKEIPSPPRPSQCQCACNKMANLSRGRRVEMSFSIANGPGTTLRNRIQVVVRLLRLRGESKKKAKAKAEAEAETKLALEQAVKPILGQAKTINKMDQGAVEDEADDDDDDDEGYQSTTDSTPSRSSTSSPNHMLLYEDQPIAPSYQPEREFSFDFELQPALRRISQWTGALAPDFGCPESSDSELECADSEQLFGYFFRYIVFMITVLGRAAADHNLGPRLRD